MGDIQMEIAIPTDNEGFVLLQCEWCKEFFKLIPDEMESDEVIEIWCPCCGLRGDEYFTEEVIELGMKMAENFFRNSIFEEMKKWERKVKGKGISFKAGKRPKEEEELPIVSVIDDLEIQKYNCCKKEAKIKPLIKMCGSYCPYCGVLYYEYK